MALRHAWDAKQHQAANEALAAKLVTAITATIKPDDAAHHHPGGPRRGQDHRDYSPLHVMRLGRKPQTAEVDPEFAQLVAGLYVAFEDNVERCARLTRRYHEGANAGELREEALAGVRRIAYVERIAFEAMAHVIDIRTLAPGILPMGVHSALARLGYALIALAEEDPEPEALLSQDDIHALAHQYEIEDWVMRHREHNPRLKGAKP